jgi:hypothetical protein
LAKKFALGASGLELNRICTRQYKSADWIDEDGNFIGLVGDESIEKSDEK